jgi:hypothetical protein
VYGVATQDIVESEIGDESEQDRTAGRGAVRSGTNLQ